MKGVKFFNPAAATLEDIEVAHRFCKRPCCAKAAKAPLRQSAFQQVAALAGYLYPAKRVTLPRDILYDSTTQSLNSHMKVRLN